ncbi:MAG TPA: extracellular solute-binding protein, partial [Streptosporangiaceae bacterium]
MTIWGSYGFGRRGRAIGAASALLTAGAVVAACGSASQQTAAPKAATSGSSIAGQTITLYNGQHEQTTDALVKAFEKQTGAVVKVRSDDEDVLAQQIAQEGDHSPADVFYTENTPPLVRLDEKGLLAPVSAAALADVPAKDSAADHDWVGVSARLSVLVYNTRDLKPSQLPTSVLGLASPKWKGKLDIAPSETDFQPIVTSVAADIGNAATVRWLKALKANAGVHTDPDNETLVANVNRGVTQLGVINHYYWYRLRDENGSSGIHSALARFAPHDDGYLLDVSGAAVLKSSQHQQAAQALVKFLVSNGGQQVLVHSDSWEYPIGDGVTNPALPPL